jgi:DNA-binding CsgD family transcriptional regulator
MKFALEEIYNAATDDECFAGLAARLAQRLGARSGVVHYTASSPLREETSYSGWFTPEQMEVYSAEFAGDDLWAHALQKYGGESAAIDCSSLVPPRVYEESKIYNEWVRAIGDDTFHCIAASFKLGEVTAKVGFHRGRLERPFSEATLAELDRLLPHLRRMLRIRTQLMTANMSAALYRSALDAMAQATFIVDSKGLLLKSNITGEEMLRRGDVLRLSQGRLTSFAAAQESAIECGIAEAAHNYLPTAIRIKGEHNTYCDLSFVPVGAGVDGQKILVLANGTARSDPTLTIRLSALYRLTSAEAVVASLLSDGLSVADIAACRHASVETVRSQVKSIMSKLGCRRQGEIIARIAHLPLFDRVHLGSRET